MKYFFATAKGLLALASAAFASGSLAAHTIDLGHGFLDHGPATDSSNSRGLVATVDGHGRDVVLMWLMDHRGGYELVMIDAATGHAEEFPTPFPLTTGDSPYASLLSKRNRFYTQFDGYFVEFDPAQRAFTFHAKTPSKAAMSLTEDAHGVIWSAGYPDCHLASFDPAQRRLRDHGVVNRENWDQYPRAVAADDAGWIYVGIGNTATQLVAYDSASGTSRALLAPNARARGLPNAYAAENGRVYAQALREAGSPWFELYRGEVHPLAGAPPSPPQAIVAGNQALFHREFPDGRKIAACDPVERRLEIADPEGAVHRLTFDYASDGAIVMGAAAAPDGTVCGGTTFPMRWFSYDPHSDRWQNRPTFGQWNVVTVAGPKFYAAAYGGGLLLSWDPSQPWVETNQDNPASNPRLLTSCDPDIHRPTSLLVAGESNELLLMAGTPEYGYTGGGLLFWNLASGHRTLLSHTALLPNQSTLSLVSLAPHRVLGGTTTSPGTGGEKKAAEAELYELNPTSQRIVWHQAVIPGAQEYTDLILDKDHRLLGVVDRTRYFVFDPEKRALAFIESLPKDASDVSYQQGPRHFVRDSRGRIFLLARHAIYSASTDTGRLSLVARPPIAIDAGGDWLEDRIYFVSGSHLCSYAPGP